jgi:hypothetical protein
VLYGRAWNQVCLSMDYHALLPGSPVAHLDPPFFPTTTTTTSRYSTPAHCIQQACTAK